MSNERLLFDENGEEIRDGDRVKVNSSHEGTIYHLADYDTFRNEHRPASFRNRKGLYAHGCFRVEAGSTTETTKA